MNAVVNHIMQTVDWTRFSLEEWLYQFFLNGVCRHELNNADLAFAMFFLNGVCRHELTLSI